MSDYKDPFCILPLRDIVVFPNMIVPLFVGRVKSIKALEYAEKNEKFKGTLALETLRKATVKDIVEETDTDNSKENYCLSHPMMCEPDEHCKIDTFKISGKFVWSKNYNHKKYVDAAKERKISCGVVK